MMEKIACDVFQRNAVDIHNADQNTCFYHMNLDNDQIDYDITVYMDVIQTLHSFPLIL